MRSARIALCGDSLATRSFRARLPVALQRTVDWRFTAENAVPFATLAQCLEAIERGESRSGRGVGVRGTRVSVRSEAVSPWGAPTRPAIGAAAPGSPAALRSGKVRRGG